MVVRDSIQDFETARWRHGANGKFSESQPAVPVSEMESSCGGVPEQRLNGRSMVPGK